MREGVREGGGGREGGREGNNYLLCTSVKSSLTEIDEMIMPDIVNMSMDLFSALRFAVSFCIMAMY